MDFKENVTKLVHKTYGEGVFVKTYSDSAITVYFPNVGTKNLSITAFNNGLLKLKDELKAPVTKESKKANDNAEATIQYDTSSTQIGERNVLEATSSSNTLIFNESYTVIGNEFSAKKIYACYNLTVVGDIVADEIEIKGSFTVLGNAMVKTLHCQNTFYCNGKLVADKVEVGRDIIAESIKCPDLYCGGNVIAQTTIDIENSETEKTMIAGEGIVGGGNFSVQNAIAVEYFAYDGDIKGKVFELDTDSSFGNNDDMVPETSNIGFEELIQKAKEVLTKEINVAGDKSEDDLLEYAMRIADATAENTVDWFDVFSKVIDISYLDEIEDFGDYLILVYAKQILPKEMTEYETVEHIFGLPMQEAKEKGLDLPITYKSIDDFELYLKIILSCYEQIGFDKEELLDKLFQAVGIKYNTVKSFF